MAESFDGVRVLFVCVANSARSPMAAALAPRFLGDRVIVSSAGREPTDCAHPYAVEVMREVGLDISAHVPRSIDTVDADEVDLIVTLCEDAVRPTRLMGKPWLDARIANPALHAMEFSRVMAVEGFRSAREDIEDVLKLLASKGPGL